ncbi:hypothetical protein [Xylanibacter muris]|uniref:Alkyl hydroperoxide reductase subunit C/ Thiol specific antioxidant domain-containing protein n=1 Tax=Xylanibacter muris TaxID=2736290 RepID=A0ABX2AKA3_9BACT|nr:hypothetical protein [Xylanibacter muris]NPD91626.1 hypothetical protein [Xylanibacter muris]NPD91633.1 hypothetical protein [Xylanibacter muris]
MKFLAVILLPLVGLFVSCGGSTEIKDSLDAMLSHPVRLSLDRMKCSYRGSDTLMADSIKPDLRLVVYVDSSECSSCVLDQMYHWNEMLSESRKYDGRLQYVFIVAPRPSQLEDARLSLEYCGLQSPVYVDTGFVFRCSNPWFPSGRMYHTFLLNRNDSVLLVGSPLDNPNINELFTRTVKSVITNNSKNNKL